MRYLFLLLFFVSIGAQAQVDKFNRFSVEFTTGVHAPLSPGTGISRSNYVAFNQFQFSLRYMFTEKFGLKGHFANNRFEDKNNANLGIGFHRLGLEGVANIGKLLNVSYRLREHVGLLAHAGGGITFAYPESIDGAEHIGNIMVGFTGQIYLSRRFTLIGDLSFVSSQKQHYGYNGALLDPNYEGESGSFVNVSVGIQLNLGQEKYHADWY